MSESWPDHSAELGRKAMERIGRVVDAYQTGDIAAQQLWLEADVLSEVTQGLIDKETWNTIYAVRQEATEQIRRSR